MALMYVHVDHKGYDLLSNFATRHMQSADIYFLVQTLCIKPASLQACILCLKIMVTDGLLSHLAEPDLACLLRLSPDTWPIVC